MKKRRSKISCQTPFNCQLHKLYLIQNSCIGSYSGTPFQVKITEAFPSTHKEGQGQETTTDYGVHEIPCWRNSVCFLYFRDFHILYANCLKFRRIPCRITGQNFAEFRDYFRVQNFIHVYLSRDTLQGSCYPGAAKASCSVDASRCS